MPKFKVVGTRVEYYFTEVEAENSTDALMILGDKKNIVWDSVDNSEEIQVTGDIKEIK